MHRALLGLLAKIKGIFRERLWSDAGGLGSHGGSPNQGAADIRRSNGRMADGAFNPGYWFFNRGLVLQYQEVNSSIVYKKFTRASRRTRNILAAPTCPGAEQTLTKNRTLIVATIHRFKTPNNTHTEKPDQSENTITQG